MRTPNSKKTEGTSFADWPKEKTISQDTAQLKQNENINKDSFAYGSKITSVKGFIIPKPNSTSTGYSKALRTATYKMSTTTGIRTVSRTPLSETQTTNKDKRVQVRTGVSQQRVDMKEKQLYGRESSLAQRSSSSKLYGLPPTSNRTPNGTKDIWKRESTASSNYYPNRKITTEGNTGIKKVEKLQETANSKYDGNSSQDYSLNQRKTSNMESSGISSTPTSYRPNYHTFTNKINRVSAEKVEQEETQKISRPKTIHDNNLTTPKQQANQEKRTDDSSERETYGSSSEGQGSSEKKSKLREMLENATNYKAPETVAKTNEVQNKAKKETESINLSSEEKRRESRISSHVSILSTPVALGEPRGLVGLRNIGNTCFMNSTLQCLFNTPLFSDYFLRGNHLKEKNPKSKGLADAFANLLEKMRAHKGGPSYNAESTYDVKSRISKVNPIFSGYEQHDAQELLKATLEGINDDLNRVVTKPPYKELCIHPNKKIQDTSDEWFDYMLGRDNSIVTDLFCGQLLSKTRCTHCNHESLAFDNYWDLALSFSKGASAKSNLTDMMEQFLKEEELDDPFYCEKCKTRRPSKKKFILWRMPKVLVIQLKRFEYTKWRREKINKTVVFPVKNFDLSEFTKESTDSSVRDCRYTLFGMVNHGGSLSGGHYTADCMNPYNRKWYTFNDSSVSETYMKGEEADSSAPYILFYVKSSCLSQVPQPSL